MLERTELKCTCDSALSCPIHQNSISPIGEAPTATLLTKDQLKAIDVGLQMLIQKLTMDEITAKLIPYDKKLLDIARGLRKTLP